VLVVDGGGSLRRALLGGNLGAAAARNGWAGVVVDGACATWPNWPPATWASARWRRCRCPPRSATKASADVPVVIQGVIVRPGEWLYADEDGIVVMPQPA
jgi:regulator of ribonuclease activity A